MKRVFASTAFLIACGVLYAGCGGGSSGGGGGGTAPPPASPAAPAGPTATTGNSSSSGGNVSSPPPSSSTSGNTGGTTSTPPPSGGTTTPPPSGGGTTTPPPSGGGGTTTPPPPPPGPTTPPPPANYTESSDTVKIYVSSSGGNDSNDGLSPGTAVKTLSKGVSLLRNGMPDWLLLKKGDSWNEVFGRWKKCGRSAEEPMVIWAYGSGARPQLRTGGTTALKSDNGGGTPTILHSLCFVGLSFWAHTRDPDSPWYSGTSGAAGIQWLRGSRDIVFDDLKVDSYSTNIVIQNHYNDGSTNWTLRNCVVLDSYNTGGHSQGIYVDGVSNMTIEDCVFDHNGWNDQISGAEATMFNHNVYLQYNCSNMVVRRNVLTRASSHGVQIRSGGVCDDNFGYQNPINILMGYNSGPTSSGQVCRNVILEANDITADLPRGWGIEFRNVSAVTVEENIVAHVATNSVNRRSIEEESAGTYTGNIVYDWPVQTGIGYGENLITPGPWEEPNRSVSAYDATVGGPGTEANFYNKIRSQSRDTYDANYTAGPLSAYVRAGFVPQ